MFNFFRHNVSTDATDSRPMPHAVPPSAPPSVHPHADIQRELVRVVLKDTLRRHGIPSDWLTCEVNTVATDSNTEELHIQLVIMQWHELMMRYARALEIQLLRGLDRFEPGVDHIKKCRFSWRFAAECACPFLVLPPPVVWSHDVPTAPVAEEQPSVLDRRHTKRPPKGTARAAAPAAPVANASSDGKPPDRDGDNYQRTELSPFR